MEGRHFKSPLSSLPPRPPQHLEETAVLSTWRSSCPTEEQERGFRQALKPGARANRTSPRRSPLSEPPSSDPVKNPRSFSWSAAGGYSQACFGTGDYTRSPNQSKPPRHFFFCSTARKHRAVFTGPREGGTRSPLAERTPPPPPPSPGGPANDTAASETDTEVAFQNWLSPLIFFTTQCPAPPRRLSRLPLLHPSSLARSRQHSVTLSVFILFRRGGIPTEPAAKRTSLLVPRLGPNPGPAPFIRRPPPALEAEPRSADSQPARRRRAADIHQHGETARSKYHHSCDLFCFSF